jgi:hypothetical protein
MKQTIRNKTNDTQQVCFCNGSAETFYPGASGEVDFNDLFPEEVTRVNSIFDVQGKPQPESPVRYKQSKKYDGGDE